MKSDIKLRINNAWIFNIIILGPVYFHLVLHILPFIFLMIPIFYLALLLIALKQILFLTIIIFRVVLALRYHMDLTLSIAKCCVVLESPSRNVLSTTGAGLVWQVELIEVSAVVVFQPDCFDSTKVADHTGLLSRKENIFIQLCVKLAVD